MSACERARIRLFGGAVNAKLRTVREVASRRPRFMPLL